MTAIPAEMTYIRIERPGPPEVLMPDRMEVPRPGAGEVLVKVAAAGINRPDVLQREGGYPPPPGATDVPGLEVAGEVVAVGEEAARWRAGDKVMALVSSGGYAEYCLAPAPQVLPVPPGLSMVEAGGVPETFFTVWTNVFDHGRLREGESFLVHGGSSGIGTTAIQLAHAFGATVFATVGGEDKRRACENLGAKRAINYRSEDFVAAVKEATDGRGADVIYDPVGGDTFDRSRKCIAFEGRILVIGFTGGRIADAPTNHALVKNYSVVGLHWGLYRQHEPRLLHETHAALVAL
ncbi:MAG TPA: NAD(P)H-quinone oxidoreductase, partial [Geminicoccaceae bacterium]|nr:NAD(P)H-quinone oxidoreductase [Geminicoccaceae bacterium]